MGPTDLTVLVVKPNTLGLFFNLQLFKDTFPGAGVKVEAISSSVNTKVIHWVIKLELMLCAMHKDL